MRPTDSDGPRDVGLFEMWMGLTPEEWDALPDSQDDGADLED